MPALFRRTQVSLAKRLYLSAVGLAYLMGVGLMVRLLHKRGRGKVSPTQRNSQGNSVLLSRGPLVCSSAHSSRGRGGLQSRPKCSEAEVLQKRLGVHEARKGKRGHDSVSQCAQDRPPLCRRTNDARQSRISELKLYPEAYKQLKAAVDANGDNLPARNSLGSLYALARQFPDAQAQAEYILQQSPKDVDALLLLGVSLAGQQKLSESEQEFRNVLEVSPGNLPALTNLAILKMMANQPDVAESLLKEAVDKKPERDATVSCACELLH